MNDDLISRQAAIDAIRASTSKYTGFMEMEMYTDDDDAVEAINGVPSAQQRGTVVTCGIDKCKNNVDGLCIAKYIYLSEDHSCYGGCDDGWDIDEEEEEE